MKLIYRLLGGALLLASLAACDVSSSNRAAPATAEPAPIMTSGPEPEGGPAYPAPADTTAYPAPAYPTP